MVFANRPKLKLVKPPEPKKKGPRQTFKDLVRQGRDTGMSQVRWYVNLEKYRRAETYKLDGFSHWTTTDKRGCLDKLVKLTRKARSTLMAKLSVVQMLIDSGMVKYTDIEQMGDTNATNLARLHKAKGINRKWIALAKKVNVDSFKEAVSKAIKPTREIHKRLTYVVPTSLYVAWSQQFGRLQTLLHTENRVTILDFITALLAGMTDDELAHAAGEMKDEPKEKKK
jgi:hypothetical protein